MKRSDRICNHDDLLLYFCLFMGSMAARSVRICNPLIAAPMMKVREAQWIKESVRICNLPGMDARRP